MVPLNTLQPGESAQVGEILGDAAFVHRLREMGMHNGAAIQMIRGGSPCIIRLGSRTLCFRAEEVSTVLVIPGVPT